MMGKLLEVRRIGSDEIAYNPCVIVQKNAKKIVNGKNIIAVRVENLESYWFDRKRYDPHIMFFERVGDSLEPIPDAPVFHQYEDPWSTWITGPDGQPQLLFGGVKIDYGGPKLVITTQIHMAGSVQELDPHHPVAVVRGMKDVRLAETSTGKLAVFTRPTRGKGFPGRIGFTMIDRIQDLEKSVKGAHLLKFDLDKKTRIGANEVFAVKNSLHVFCHLATADPIKRQGKEIINFEQSTIHYAGYEFNLDPNPPFAAVIPLRKIADRSDFPANDKFGKGERFKDVIFPGGTGGPDLTEFYTGVEDARVGVMNL